MTLGDQLVVVEAGRVVQAGTPDELSSRPRSRYVAELLGLNLYRGRPEQHAVVLPGGRRLIAADPVPQDPEVFAVIRPRAVSLHRELPEGSPRNVWQGAVGDLDVAGDRVRVHVGGDLPVIAEVTPGAVAALRLGEGGQVFGQGGRDRGLSRLMHHCSSGLIHCPRRALAPTSPTVVSL
jgi:molybdate transport system ATP-binding protein